MGWESFGVVGFDLGPLLQGQTWIAKLKNILNILEVWMVNQAIKNHGLGIFRCGWI